MNRIVFSRAGPGGLNVLADHSGTSISVSGTLRRIEEEFLRQDVEAAGGELPAEGNFPVNPIDRRDKNMPDPLQPKDKFVLKFANPECRR